MRKKGEDELILSGGCSRLEIVGLFARSLDDRQNQGVEMWKEYVVGSCGIRGREGRAERRQSWRIEMR